MHPIIHWLLEHGQGASKESDEEKDARTNAYPRVDGLINAKNVTADFHWDRGTKRE
jgi:hypothetical protein